jgi:hypothetical protein
MLNVWAATERLSGLPGVLFGPFSGLNPYRGVEEMIVMTFPRQRFVRSFSTALFLLGVLVSTRPAAAQAIQTSTAPQTPAGTTASPEPADPNPGAFTLTGGTDFVNQYMFRGLRQNSTGMAIWPWADLGIAAYSGKGGVKSVGVNIGTWNSLNTGDTGTDGPSTKLWYESDFYATLGLGFGGGVSVATTYTAYTSPNNSYSTVKEIMFKVAVDDSAYLGKAAVKPYVILAQELDTAPGLGQADGGTEAGTYLELGAAPGYSFSKASVAVPVKLGVSLSNYYELDGTDNTFGFFSIAGIVTVPLGSTTKFGSWNLHGGAEFQKLGDTTAFFNGGDNTQVIGSIGIGFSY